MVKNAPDRSSAPLRPNRRAHAHALRRSESRAPNVASSTSKPDREAASSGGKSAAPRDSLAHRSATTIHWRSIDATHERLTTRIDVARPRTPERSSCAFVSNEQFSKLVPHEIQIFWRKQFLVRRYGRVDPRFDPRIIEERMHGLEKLSQAFRKNHVHPTNPPFYLGGSPLMHSSKPFTVFDSIAHFRRFRSTTPPTKLDRHPFSQLSPSFLMASVIAFSACCF